MWILFPVAAAAFWGLSYTLTERVLRDIGGGYILIANGLAAFLVGVARVHMANGWGEIAVLMNSRTVLFTLLSVAATGAIATLLTLIAIERSNAVVASMVEITYPAFVALFAWWLIGLKPTPAAMVGLAVIIAGVMIVKVGAGFMVAEAA